MEPFTVCGGAVRVIAFIEGPAPAENTLTHLDAITAKADASHRPLCRMLPRRRGLA